MTTPLDELAALAKKASPTSSRNTPKKSESSDTCVNCDRHIGRLEQPYVWNENVVCSECFGKLSNAQKTQPGSSVAMMPRTYVYLAGLCLLALAAFSTLTRWVTFGALGLSGISCLFGKILFSGSLVFVGIGFYKFFKHKRGGYFPIFALCWSSFGFTLVAWMLYELLTGLGAYSDPFAALAAAFIAPGTGLYAAVIFISGANVCFAYLVIAARKKNKTSVIKACVIGVLLGVSCIIGDTAYAKWKAKQPQPPISPFVFPKFKLR